MFYLFVFLSGAAALIYEVVWARQLATFLGITTYAHTVVLASFMAGLALGAWIFGRLADRFERPLRLFALLEAGIASFGLATLALVPALQRLYIFVAPQDLTGWSAHGARLLIAGLAVLPAAMLMGGTLPALVRGLQSAAQPLSRTIAGIYGLNTLGAATGALVSAYLLLPALGTRGSLLAAVGLNLMVTAGVLATKGRRDLPPPTSSNHTWTEPPLPDTGRRLLLIGFGLSGAAALALQIGWIRALTQVIGSSVYAFGLTTASYLVGLALGSLVAAVIAERLARQSATLATAALLEVAVGLTVIAGIPVLGKLPELFLAGYRLGIHESFPGLQVFLFLLASTVIVVPTLFLGALLPLLTSRAPHREAETGRDVGVALATNSFGTVAGTLLSGLALLPLLGAGGLLRLAAVSNVAVGGVLWIACDSHFGRKKRVLLATGLVAFIATTLSIPGWDPALTTSGPFINAARFVDVPPGQELRDWLRHRSRILYYNEGVEATVSVRDVGDERLLVINGKTDGSRNGDRRTQLMLAHLPLLSHPLPQRVLLVGLGTGMSAAAAAAHADVSKLSVVELSSEVIEASRFFLEENESVLDDPRLLIEPADARNFLLTTEEPFDVILSEPSNPWITGVANLFTHEYFTLARERLAAGGIMAQWFQTYGMSNDDLKSVLRSFADAFPQVSVWSPQLGDLLFVGSLEPLTVFLTRFEHLLQSARGGDQLESIDLVDTAALARMFLLDDAGVRSFVSDSVLNTDDRPRVEFNAPRNLYSETTVENLVAIIDHLDGRSLTVPLEGLARTRSNGAFFDAIGLSIELPPGTRAHAEWKVNWTALKGSESLPAPLGVGNRTMVTLSGRGRDIEIERGWENLEPSSAELLASLRARTAGTPTALGNATIASGQPVVWSSGSSNGRPFAAMAWSCGGTTDRFSRYTLLVPELERDPEQFVHQLAATVSCTDEDPKGTTALDSEHAES